jgi:DNA-binding transcriptional regulator LsrR (DeoR family)
MTTARERESNLINIRRSRISELLAKGYTNQAEIARTLNISEPTVCRDIQFLTTQANQRVKAHVERIAMCYSEAEIGLKMVLRKAFDLSGNPNNSTSENLQSLSTITTTIGKLMELSADEKTIAQAISWIESKKKELQQQEQQQEPSLVQKEPIQEQEQENE